MEVKYSNNGYNFTAYYDENGRLDYVEDYVLKMKLMIRLTQSGAGYTLGHNCNATYAYVIVAKMYIPNFIYIKSE